MLNMAVQFGAQVESADGPTELLHVSTDPGPSADSLTLHEDQSVCRIEPVSSAPMPADVRPVEANAPQASAVEIRSQRPRSRASSMAAQFGALVDLEADETAASSGDPDIRISGHSDAARKERTAVTVVSPRRRRQLL